MKIAELGLPCMALVCSSAVASAQGSLAQFSGSALGEHLGFAVAGLGDIDGDGVGDFAAGAPWKSTNTTHPGRVVFLRGATATFIREVVGSAPADDFGRALANAGDVDGDGVNDLLVGAPDHFLDGGHDTGGATPGYVALLSGASGTWLLSVNGDSAKDMFGSALTGVDDVDGDGLEDFAVGAPGHDGGAAEGGLVRLVSGASGATIWQRLGTQTWAELGTRLATVDDVNGDGLLDLVASAPVWDGAGAVFLLSGADGSTLRLWIGEEEQIRFGSALAGTGDVDGDGIGDVAVSATGAPWPTGKGTLYVFSTATGALRYQCSGAADFTHFGQEVASIGDLDGDGVAELAVGAPGHDPDGQGPEDGAVFLLSGASGAELGRSLGANAEKLGISAAGIGDVDLDGRPELAAGGYGSDQSGIVRVIAADWPPPPASYCSAKVNSQGCTPSISATGTPSLSGPDDFTVRAVEVINQKSGLFLWGPRPNASAFMGGTLCVGPPLTRSSPLSTGGSPGGADCSGSLAYLFTNAYMQSHGLFAGSMLYVQGWYRDPFLPAQQIGLTDGLLAIVAP